MPPALAACLRCGTGLAPATPGSGGMRKFCSMKCRDRATYLRYNHRPEKPCRRCGSTIPAGSHSNRDYCSEACKKAVDSEVAKAVYPTKYVPRPLHERTCISCGKSFMAKQPHGKACSKKCLNRWHLTIPKYKASLRRVSDAKKAMQRGAERALKFDAFMVFERDGWTCQICGQPTPKELRGTVEQNAPELDHVIPLKRGGEHSPSNTQCSCLRCNRRKSAKVAA